MGGDERLRLFCALRLPDGALDELERWQAAEIRGGRPVPRRNLHVTLAFLGSRPAADVATVAAILRDAAARARPPQLEPVRYRETRGAGMLVLADRDGHAGRLADDVQERLEEAGLYRRERRPWLPHVTVVRFRAPLRLAPPLPATGTFVPSDAAAYLSRLHPDGVQYEVLEFFRLGG